MSKLQALAAARKKKIDEKKELERVEKGVETLSVRDSQKENDTTLSQKRHMPQPTPQVVSPLNDIESQVTPDDNKQQDVGSPSKGGFIDEDFTVVVSQATPSAFAQTLFGSAPVKTHRPDVFAMPYTSSSSFTAHAFAEPSPDDIVLAAQAKGSNFTRTK